MGGFVKPAIFVIGSTFIAWFSRASLRDIRSHGFYRFFAWEAMLALVLINIEYWFVEPFSPHQIIAWVLLLVSLLMVIAGFSLLRKGISDESRGDPALLDWEKTTELVTTGVYRYIRHPLYSSLLFLTWGVFFKYLSWVGLTLAALATLFLYMTARIEEAENIEYWEAEYQSYMKTTKMFVPFMF
ncbi:MAG: isoprenylcysteine carboxylmethyltransferase family protein [Chloroflexi bacterium]|nr:isoprenylcysteine carboxylmethyltransferase family protein [Chloroflexota bacterium]